MNHTVDNPHWNEVLRATEKAHANPGETVYYRSFDGKRCGIKVQKDGSLLLTLPKDSTRSPGDRRTINPSCDIFSWMKGECDLSPQRENLLKEKINHLRNGAHDENGARSLENYLGYLKRQTLLNPGGRRLTWKHNKAQIIAAVEEDNRKEQAIDEIKLRIEEPAPPPEQIKPGEDETVEDFMKRCVATDKSPEECRGLWFEAHPETEGSKEGERRSETASFDKVEPESVGETDETEELILTNIKRRKRK